MSGGLQKALAASLAKRSVATMDPPYTAAFNAALDMVERDVAPFLVAPPTDATATGLKEAIALAVRFHETYERLAPSFGYETRPDTKAFDPETPNGRLMIAVCAALLPSASVGGEREACNEDGSTDFHREVPTPRREALARMTAMDDEMGLPDEPLAAPETPPTETVQTPPALSEDLRGVLEFYADRDGDGYRVDVTNYGLSTEEGDIVRDGGERARAALARAQGQAS